ncbi:hypothetical protein UFOVP1636_142 [uncultured Caudovirales phage]|uniref:YubB ferredoxin-like domain-containing protein n=1 Tax=uncultured Caudovirales phage TaxID=2100421 RepID=A0A6J5SZZ9_9CAUD|nr:hypothetical protein UFOVP1636_142 [uncultured Caudovirales phage]
MPNWCDNKLILEHDDPEVIERAGNAFAKGEFLNTLVPRPTEHNENWYTWNIENWGTKWDIGENDGFLEVTPNKITLSFTSAWAPPLMAYKSLLDQGFGVYATYYEPGIGFCGIWDNGDDQQYDYSHLSKEELVNTIPPELDEEYGISDYYDSDDFS